MSRFLLLLLAALSMIVLSPLHAAAPPAYTENDVQDIIYLGDNGPMVIRLRVRIDGKSFRSVWKAFINDVFDHADTNKDGVLSLTELRNAPRPATLFGGGFFAPGGFRSGPGFVRGQNKMTRAQFLKMFQANGATPFTLAFKRGTGGVIRINAFGGQDTPSADALNARLFALLDTNKDGKLSKQEMAAADKVLAKMDLDEDELITPAELQGQAPTSSANDGGNLVLSLGNDSAPVTRPFHASAVGKSDPELAKKLLARYGTKGAKTVTAKQLGLNAAMMAKLDADKDGTLDLDELGTFSKLPAALEFTLNLGKRQAGKAEVELTKGQGTALAKKVKKEKTGLVLDLGTVKIDLRLDRGPRSEVTFAGFNPREQYITQFKNADTDNNGYIDKKEAEKSPFFRGSFAQMDTDGDGQLFQKEMLAYLDKIEALQKKAKVSCVSLIVTEEGKGLFDLLDTDKDGQLSVRELRQMPKLLASLDGNKDGYLTLGEIPRVYRAGAELGSSSDNSFGRVVAFVAGGPLGQRPTKALPGPVWFRKMDRNRDGDVSRAEFLGTDEAFKKIDTDGDGLISLAEAEAFDKRSRQKK